jgi:hypothetical protein
MFALLFTPPRQFFCLKIIEVPIMCCSVEAQTISYSFTL